MYHPCDCLFPCPRNYSLGFRIAFLCLFSPFSTDDSPGRIPQIVAFSDASFGTLRNSGSIESFAGILGIPLKRKEAILRRGGAISFYGKKISRVARSTARAEGIALANAADSTLPPLRLPWPNY